jgi:uncharacterized protein (TIGR03435 family)
MRLTVSCCIALLVSGVAGFAAGPTFDAASVKLISPEVVLDGRITGGPGTSDPGRFRAPRINMWNLLTKAFGMNLDQFVGPAWLREYPTQNLYAVMATMPPDTTQQQFQLMLQNLMAERFHLVFHSETRNYPGYELVLDRGGPKLKEVTPTPADDPGAGTSSIGFANPPRGADGFPTLPDSGVWGRGDGSGGQTIKYQERTMDQFVSSLGVVIGNSQGKGAAEGYPQPRVVDRTGLTGTYTFTLQFQGVASPRLTPPGGAAPAASDPEGGFPNIFTAIQKQLGLRLNKTADVPVDVIVVESLDKVPTEN